MDPRLNGIRVIIVEDHDDTRDYLEQALAHLGGTVTAVATAREALALVTAADIIVTDFSMPDEDGVWLLEQVNQQPRPIPVIGISGFAEQHVPRLAQAPFARRLLKPLDAGRLGQIIIDVLRSDGDSPTSPASALR